LDLVNRLLVVWVVSFLGPVDVRTPQVLAVWEALPLDLVVHMDLVVHLEVWVVSLLDLADY
jgi:hypothetical protein